MLPREAYPQGWSRQAGRLGRGSSLAGLGGLHGWKVMPVCQSCRSHPSDVVFRSLLTLSGSASGSGPEGYAAVSQPDALPAAGTRKEGIEAGKDREERAIWDTTEIAMMGGEHHQTVVPPVNT